MKKLDILSSLNDSQKKAVTHQDGPLLIVAGAGTGKTTVLINRLAWLILEKGVDPEEILLTTFTEKGANELEERADKLLPYGYVNLWINTFHGLCERILRDHALDIGLSPSFTLLNQTEQWIFIRKHITELGLNYYKPIGDPTKFIHEIISHFSRLKDENIASSKYLEYAQNLKDGKESLLSSKDKDKKNNDDEDSQAAEAMELSRIYELAEAYHSYNRLMIQENFLDFGDLIVKTIELLKTRPNILKKYRSRFRYIMVDEFQDTNSAQYELIKLLSAPNNNLVAVGDDDQSIYRFRGAALSNIMQFKDDFPKAKQVVLTDNYRSGQTVLDHSYQLITNNNPDRLEVKLKLNKKLKSQTDFSGEAIYLDFNTEYQECLGVAERIKLLKESGLASSWAQIAVLVRANDTADKFVKELTRQNIPNHFVSLKGLYYKPIILNALAYFKLLDHYHEPAALYRVLRMPAFRLDHDDLLLLNLWARKNVLSLFETLKQAVVVPKLSKEAVKKINHLLSLITRHTALVNDKKTSRVFLAVVHDCLIPYLDQDLDHLSFSYLNQFYHKIKKFEEADEAGTLKDFLALINLEMEAGETGGLRFNFDDADTVKVMTVHAAKGLEFEHVFIVNAVNKRFPTINRSDKLPIPDALGVSAEQNVQTHTAEERRLFYVAMTRSKKGLYVTGAKDYGGVQKKKPSAFIEEAKLSTLSATGEEQDELSRDLKTLNNPEEKTSLPLPVSYSFSQLELFEKCPWQYKLIYLLKLPQEENHYFVFGRVIHSVLRQFFLPLTEINSQQKNLFGQAEKSSIDLSLKKLLALYEQYWINNGYEDRQQAEDYKEAGLKMLKQMHEEMAEEKPVWLEKKFNLPLGKYKLTGVIDRVDKLPDGTYEIIDYKTGKAPAKLTPQNKKQLILYQAALEEIFKMKVSKLTFYYLKDNEKKSFTAKGEEIITLKERLLELIEEIQTFDFTARPEIMCKNCPYKSLCEFIRI